MERFGFSRLAFRQRGSDSGQEKKVRVFREVNREEETRTGGHHRRQRKVIVLKKKSSPPKRRQIYVERPEISRPQILLSDPIQTQRPQSVEHVTTVKEATTQSSPALPSEVQPQKNIEQTKFVQDVEKAAIKTSEGKRAWQATLSNSCITCLIVWLIVLGVLFLLALGFCILALVVFFWNGKPTMDNWSYLTSYD